MSFWSFHVFSHWLTRLLAKHWTFDDFPSRATSGFLGDKRARSYSSRRAPRRLLNQEVEPKPRMFSRGVSAALRFEVVWTMIQKILSVDPKNKPKSSKSCMFREVVVVYNHDICSALASIGEPPVLCSQPHLHRIRLGRGRSASNWVDCQSEKTKTDDLQMGETNG